ncbi:unnamed protein product [Moneuplotes crassus]|uniref:Uncharacterized protein n=1 Tax=Euplotes crassus TaxID=5936 RepID=A0AAD1Y839_EUPCR|nr:unnamed protein product [Moneuplotes crassus]
MPNSKDYTADHSDFWQSWPGDIQFPQWDYFEDDNQESFQKNLLLKKQDGCLENAELLNFAPCGHEEGELLKNKVSEKNLKTTKNQKYNEEISASLPISEIKQKDPIPYNLTQEASLCAPNLRYKGNKNSHKKGKFADRADVINKTIMRSIKRYLWELYISELEEPPRRVLKSNKEYYFYLEKMFKKYFLDIFKNKYGESEVLQEKVKQVFSLMMTLDYNIPAKTPFFVSLKRRVKIIMKKYSIFQYTQFFKVQGVLEFFEILKKSGITEKIIQSYPKLSDSREKVEDILTRYASIKRDE